MEQEERPDIDILEKWVRDMKKLYNMEDSRARDDEITNELDMISQHQEIAHAKGTA